MFYTFFIITIIGLATYNCAYANTSEETCTNAYNSAGVCPEGCKLSATACIICNENTFSATTNSTECTPCPANASSEPGATSCTCNNSDNFCTGYHQEGAGCVPNQSECSDSANHIARGIKYYGDDTCYPTKCEDTYFLYNRFTSPKCTSDTIYEQCSNSASCTTELDNCIGDDGTGTITGNITTDGTTKDYSNCTCTKTGGIENGTGNMECKYDSGLGTDTQWAPCETKSIATCDAGYCNFNYAKACTEAPKGYYSPENAIKCTACPAGSTTDASTAGAPGATAKTQCYITNTTKFNDGKDTFFLPIPDEQKIYWQSD